MQNSSIFTSGLRHFVCVDRESNSRSDYSQSLILDNTIARELHTHSNLHKYTQQGFGENVCLTWFLWVTAGLLTAWI